MIGRKGIGTFEEEKNNLQAKLDKDQRINQAEEVVLERIKKDYESVMTDIYNFVGYRRSI